MSNPIDERLLALTAIVTIGYQFTFFLITYFLRFDKVTDFAGSTNFMLIAVISLTVGGGYSARQWVLTACVLLWGVRLCAFLLYRIILWGEDRRFDEQRNNIIRLAFFWSLQAIWCWTVSLPITIVNSKENLPSPSGLNALDYVGWTIFALGLILEATADQQKLWYKQTPESKGRWTDVGVWKWSRHPNFFGEIVIWWGLYLSSINSLRDVEHIAVVGPIFIVLLLLFVSGIPILEKNADKRYATKDEYIQYKKVTSVLIPVPPIIYGKFPQFVKETIFLDFKLYNPGPPPPTEQAETKRNPTESTLLVDDSNKPETNLENVV